MISTQQVVQFHCLQIIRIYKQTIIRSHGFHGRSPSFFLQCVNGNFLIKMVKNIKKREEGVKNYWFETMLFMGGHLAREAFIGDESIGLWWRHNSLIQGVPLCIKVRYITLISTFLKLHHQLFIWVFDTINLMEKK